MQLVYLRLSWYPMYQVLYLGAVPENLLFANCGSARSIHLQIIVTYTEFRHSYRSYFVKYLREGFKKSGYFTVRLTVSV